MLGQDNLLLQLLSDACRPLIKLLKLLKLAVSDVVVVAVVAVWIVFDDDGGVDALFDFHDDGGDAAANDPLPTLLNDCENPVCELKTSWQFIVESIILDVPSPSLLLSTIVTELDGPLLTSECTQTLSWGVIQGLFRLVSLLSPIAARFATDVD